jgi:hypothetical protein
MVQQLLNLVKEWGKIWDVWCKGGQCLVMSELKQIKISILNIKSLIVPSLSLEHKEVF